MNELAPFVSQIFLMGVVPFAAYFLGVYIRKTVFPSPQSLVMKHQFLVAIPLSVMVIAPLIVTLGQAITDAENMSAYLITIGVIIEHGLFMNEAVCERFKAKLQPA